MSELTPVEIRSVQRAVERELTRAQDRYHGQRTPKAILLAGQPGAGKTMLTSMILPMLGNDAALINGDDYRRYHPDYKTLYKEYGPEAVPMTSAFSAAVTENLIEWFSELRYNMVIEGTGRSVDVPKKTAELLNMKDYTAEMSVIATRPLLSLISTVQRFYQMNERGTIPRATAIEAHDNVVSLLPGNLNVLVRLAAISRIAIWTREAELIYDSKRDQGLPSNALRKIWKMKWTATEITEVKAQIANLQILENRYNLGQQTVIDEIQKRFRHEIYRSREQSR